MRDRSNPPTGGDPDRRPGRERQEHRRPPGADHRGSGGPATTTTRGPPCPDGGSVHDDSPANARETREVSARPGDGALTRVDAVKDERFRRWDVATPAATIIGSGTSPHEDLDENLRRLHDEQHPAMAGHSGRMHRLDKARITHAYCSALDVTPWERDRAMGIMVDLDLTVFGSQRAVETVALVVIQYVVDQERKRRLGLDDTERIADLNADEMQSLYDLFESMTDDDRFQELLDARDITVTNVNRLTRTLREQLDAQDLEGAVLGRSPFRDPAMPAIAHSERDGGDPAAGGVSVDS